MATFVGGIAPSHRLLARAADARRQRPRQGRQGARPGHARGSGEVRARRRVRRHVPPLRRRGRRVLARRCPTRTATIVQMRISDGVHFTVDGAQYLADAVWKLLNKRWHITAQADPVAADRLHDRRRAATTTCPASAATGRRRSSHSTRRRAPSAARASATPTTVDDVDAGRRRSSTTPTTVATDHDTARRRHRRSRRRRPHRAAPRRRRDDTATTPTDDLTPAARPRPRSSGRVS